MGSLLAGLGAARDRDRWQRLASFGPRVIDAAMAGAVGVGGLFDLLVLDGTGSRVPQLTSVTITGLAIGLVIVRRWAPITALAGAVLLCSTVAATRWLPATALLGGEPDLFFPNEIVPFVAPVLAAAGLVTPVIRREAPPVAWAAGVATAAAIAALLFFPLTLFVRLAYGIAFVGLGAAGIGAGVYLRDLDRRSRDASELARRDERLDIARELHDLVAHYVTGIVVLAQAAKVAGDRDPAAAGAALERIEDAGKGALRAMRTLVGSLREADLDHAPTAPPAGLTGLDDLAVTSSSPGLAVHLEIPDELGPRVPGVVAAAVHRIVQESLTNVRRHAVEAGEVTVDVRDAAGNLVVTVVDDGRPPVGVARTEGRGFGIVGMTERAEALGGTLVAGDVAPPGHGWQVRATFPLDARPPTGAVR